MIHVRLRNFNINILLFNNRIYGLTKGQYSPTSEQGKVTKSTPLGSIDYPFNPISVALGSEGSFVARSIDVEAKHLQEIVKRAHQHHGTSFVEITEADLLVHDATDAALAFLLSVMSPPKFPTPIGVFRTVERPTYETILGDQVRAAKQRQGEGNLDGLLNRGDTWTVS